MKIPELRLKNKEERRFKSGHPWVFSNELQSIPKTIEPGSVVRVCDSGGGFIAYGFFNAHSLITVRELTRSETEFEFQGTAIPEALFRARFKTAITFRDSWFARNQSYRLVFGENDGMPGLIVDRFFSLARNEVVYVVQPHSLGMDQNLAGITEALSALEDGSSAKKTLVVRRDSSSREREGLKKEATSIFDLKTRAPIEDLKPYLEFEFSVLAVMGRTLTLSCDLISGQKTGFFFDQLQNIRLLETLLLRKTRLEAKSDTYRILDLCSYVGQWGAHLTHSLHERGVQNLEITAVDASIPALRFAKQNIEKVAANLGAKVQVHTLDADVLKPLPVEASHFQVVIADPPAFIKNRKVIPQGKQAYAQLYQTAIEKTAKGGLVVCCSCSQLLSREDFHEALGKATRRSKRRVRWLQEGSPSFDHFSRLDFQEGTYLKCFIGQVE
jgi:23S rRNA (cytosine1962-C5)-methyltransferase